MITTAIVSLLLSVTSLVQAQQANNLALRDYTWKSRTELTLKGEIKNVTLDQVRYDIDGRLQKTRIGGTPPEAPDPRAGLRITPVGPVRQIVAAKKKEALADLMRDLAALSDSYAHLPLEALHVFARQAASDVNRAIERAGTEAGLLRVQGRGLVVAGDTMIVWLDPTTFMMRRVEIVTTLDGAPVEMAVDYRGLSNGPTYQARALLRYPQRQIALTVENFEHQHVGGTR